MTQPVQLRWLVRCASGAAAIEFAMIGLLVISLILGIFELGRAMFLRNQLAFAADVAARRVLLDPSAASGDLEQLAATIRESIPFEQTELQVELELTSSGEILSITLRRPVTLLVPDVYPHSITLSVERIIALP
ncbi:hypothetical protein GI374_15285 [Paracoccus sp. S-4012]|uniref:TadE/TadG family type IV pilus assembly protein n=1 Tax=Paracoccus sp. S-4012 TaxID=2665648 RepID=UPI0012AF8583|nr:TadE/TadG family type IV pilus assembly protein [Paracoccus sp. S-4012]MRX51763.1 hypothetical protein [Paracoccus sp. S-4012]